MKGCIPIFTPEQGNRRDVFIGNLKNGVILNWNLSLLGRNKTIKRIKGKLLQIHKKDNIGSRTTLDRS